MPERFDVPIEALLRRRVTGGLIVAVLLTVFLSFAPWRSVRCAEQDTYWVSLTQEVMAMIQGTSRDVLENGNQRGGIRPERARAVASALSHGPRHHLPGHEPAAGFRPRGEVK
jgi:hypothetical protein